MVALALVALMAVALLPQPSKRSQRTDQPFGAYAGYRWRGRIASVEGSWTVPRIDPGSTPGLAGTWIAAQANGAGPPFIQVGDSELRGDSRYGAPENRYWAFWTDTKHEFHPQFLFRVEPGDALAGRLTLTRGRWTITLLDQTSGARSLVTAPDATHRSYDQAQWAQENEREASGELAPYPSLSTAHFERIAVNSEVPTAGSLRSLEYSCMSIGTSVWVPSRLEAGGFTVRETSLASLSRSTASLPCKR